MHSAAVQRYTKYVSSMILSQWESNGQETWGGQSNANEARGDCNKRRRPQPQAYKSLRHCEMGRIISLVISLLFLPFRLIRALCLPNSCSSSFTKIIQKTTFTRQLLCLFWCLLCIYFFVYILGIVYLCNMAACRCNMYRQWHRRERE